MCKAIDESKARPDVGCTGLLEISKAHKYALKELGDAFRQFSRNGRWGTCVGCPRTAGGRAYPEFCEYTERYDHQLDVAGLAFAWNAYISNASSATSRKTQEDK